MPEKNYKSSTLVYKVVNWYKVMLIPACESLISKETVISSCLVEAIHFR